MNCLLVNSEAEHINYKPSPLSLENKELSNFEPFVQETC